MKKYLEVLLLILILLLSICSCTINGDESIVLESAENKVIFEDISLKTDISSNFYDNHFYLIEKLGNNKERDEIIKVVTEKGIEKTDVLENDIKKLYSNNSQILMYSLQFKNLDRSLIIYRYDNTYQVAIAEYHKISNGLKKFKLKTIDDKLFYSVKVNKENKIGDFVLNKNPLMNTFSNQVYSLQKEKYNDWINNEFSGKDDVCCRNTSSWGACMDCTVSACGTSWICAGAFGIAPREMLAAFAVSCIGAGPNTFC